MQVPCTLDIGRVAPDRVVALARRHLGLDVVAVMELEGDSLVPRSVAEKGGPFEVKLGQANPGAGLYFRQLLAGEIPSFSGDTDAGPRAAHLPSTPDLRVGAYIGVPLRYSDGGTYGVLCGFDHEPDLSLGERDVRFMEMLAELLVADLDEQRRLKDLFADISKVIATEDIRIAWQPIVDLRSGSCLGFEALSRFSGPSVHPERTFSAAEEVGLGLQLEWLAVTQMWKALPQLRPGQFASFNLSPAALLALAGIGNQRDDLPLEKLVVEVTEHSVVDNYGELRDALAPLRERGLRLAIDDAGAGYASFHHIVELRPDFIKVDRSLVSGLADDHARRVATRAFVALAHDMGSMVIAEGVERRSDLSALRELGVDAAQGHLIGRPTFGAIARWANRRAWDDDLGAFGRQDLEAKGLPLSLAIETDTTFAPAGALDR
jgi:EAL domain-containing protein (putative c-di-GMP-specific phosphodiesterase class I)